MSDINRNRIVIKFLKKCITLEIIAEVCICGDCSQPQKN
jgi:hypothetical protein